VFLHRERVGHTLQPTALVHDAFLSLVHQRRAHWENRTQFFAVAARQMRRLLVDHARRAAATKRGAALLVTLDDALAVSDDAQRLDIVRVSDALEALATFDERQARIVELRFFAGLTVDETAEALGISAITVSRDWAVARAWLFAELTAP
jgi:RNA polymerase sigma factor (TIGR02999 family)